MDLSISDLVASLQERISAPALMVAIFLGIAGLAGRSLLRGQGGGRNLITKAFGNWQLALLATTAFVLSLASGWTTWDGMRNFTGEPLLSFMVTFGIQGVMLIIAWLIGESFATGMNHTGNGTTRGGPVASFIAVVLFPMAVATLSIAGGVYLWRNWGTLNGDQMSAVAATAGASMIILALMAAFAKSDLVSPYLQSARVVIRNAVLWVMFLACMATSVFFSFDSLFTSIFPQGERVRAAELRAQNQVAGIISDIGGTIEAKRVTETKRLLAEKAWLAYDQQLIALARAAQGSSAEIARYFDGKLEERNRALNQQRERVSTALGGAAGLNSKKTTLVDELTRLKGERGTLASDLAEKKTELDARARGLDAKRVEAMAEEKGAEGTLKTGKGPMYRQRVDELAKLQDAYKIQEERVRDAQKRSSSVDSRIAQIEREITGIEGDLAKLKGDADTAEQRIKLSLEDLPSDGSARVDPDRLVPVFEAARLEFRQDPTVEHLTKLQGLCAQLFTAMSATDVTKPRIKGIDCDPKHAAEAATVLFALNDGQKAFATQCAGGDKLAQHSKTDDLFGFARKCLADSGLPARETEQLRTKINFMDLSRDDKAHRFVVTWNAFGDGNRLAYLALAIAIAIDSLVFMSGLFGANALRSPLSDVPSLKARSAQQLEAIVENALLPDRLENARLVLNAMHPITPIEGYTQEVLVALDNASWKHAVLGVLNAGAAIGAVRRDPNRPERYLVRPELFEFLSVVAKQEFENVDHDRALTGNRRLLELRKIITVSLQPHVAEYAEVVLNHVHPITERNGFSSEIRMREIPDRERAPVRKLLNAGSALAYVQRQGDDDHYHLHRDLFLTLAKVAADHAPHVPRPPAPQIAAERPEPAFHGALQSEAVRLPNEARPIPRIAAVNPRPVTPISPVQPIASRNIEAEALGDMRSALLDAISLPLASYEVIAKEREAARRAGAALERLAGNASVHGGKAARLHDRLKQAMKASYDAQWRLLGDDGKLIATLNFALDELDGLIYPLMLSSNGPYGAVLVELIDSLEHAAQPDDGISPREQELLDCLRDCRDQLARRTRSAADWEEIRNTILRCDEADRGTRQVARA